MFYEDKTHCLSVQSETKKPDIQINEKKEKKIIEEEKVILFFQVTGSPKIKVQPIAVDTSCLVAMDAMSGQAG